MKHHNKIELSELPNCAFINTGWIFCSNKGQAKYDARVFVINNSWAYICKTHFDFFHCELGLGKGQELILKEGR